MSDMRRILLLAALATLLGTPAILAQIRGTASLSGRVRDEAGDALPGALVTLANPGAAIGAPTVVTDADGRYAFQLIPPARGFTLKVSIPDFATVIAGPFELEADREIRMDITLKRSSELEETVMVEARGEIVDTAATATSTTFNSEFLEGVPLVGRSFQDILTLAPGVTDTDGDGNPNVRGSRDTGLQIRLDGTNVTNPLTGQYGQGINLEAIEDVEIITAGASAEYGRADGGFASVITKSGGNDLEGSFKLYLRSDFLDGGGPVAEDTAPEFTDTNIYLTLGGPFVRDHLWYFGTVERLDEEEPELLPDGRFVLRTREGWRAFGKATWQVDTDNKLAFQINYDPLETGGNNFGPGVDPESDYLLRYGGPLPQITWTSVLSPSLLLQTMASRLDLDAELLPVSPDFREIRVKKSRVDDKHFAADLPCESVDCQAETAFHRFFIAGRQGPRGGLGEAMEEGPYHFRSFVDLERVTVRSDLSYSLEDKLGQHTIKGGFETNVERYEERQVQNPILIDETCINFECPSFDPNSPIDARLGALTLQIFDPVVSQPHAEGLSVGAYAQDSWKILPNLALNAGVRLDYEEIETRGDTDFNPVAEAQEALRRFDIVCDAADLAGQRCSEIRTPGRIGRGLQGIVIVPPGHPALEFDRNGDGRIEITSGIEGDQIFEDPFTIPAELVNEGFVIDNTNLSPRLSLSWDPGGDGKTKLFASWGKYYDRLFLGAVVTGQDPRSYTAQWAVQGFVDPAEPGDRSSPLTNVVSISQTDRDLRTPYTTEWTAGVERELAPEWAAGLTYISRRGEDLLQDLDINHITCPQFDDAFGVDPFAVCGDAGLLEIDRFSSPAPDLYHMSHYFNQVLRVGNFNASQYDAIDVTLRKRLHRNWQMLFGYTWSTAKGDAESFEDPQGNDPATSDKVSGYLDFDQRHVIKWQAVAHLPHEIVVGGAIEWGSGLPYSLISVAPDQDDNGSFIPQRIFSLTGEKNDQRNESVLILDARVEKRFRAGATYVTAFFEAENLLDSNDLRLLQVDSLNRTVVNGEIDFGRRFQIGAFILF